MKDWENRFTEQMAVFASILQITAKLAPEIIANTDVNRARHMIGQVTLATEELLTVLDTQPPRVLTPEEYAKKVAEGKKITFTRDEKPQ